MNDYTVYFDRRRYSSKDHVFWILLEENGIVVPPTSPNPVSGTETYKVEVVPFVSHTVFKLYWPDGADGEAQETMLLDSEIDFQLRFYIEKSMPLYLEGPVFSTDLINVVYGVRDDRLRYTYPIGSFLTPTLAEGLMHYQNTHSYWRFVYNKEDKTFSAFEADTQEDGIHWIERDNNDISDFVKHYLTK